MEEKLSDRYSYFKIPQWVLRNYRYVIDRYYDNKKMIYGRQIHPNVVHVFLSLCKLDITFRSRRFHIDSLVNLWGSPGISELEQQKLNHFTALLQLASGLEFIHSQKWIHGDITPENALIFKDYKQITMKWACFELPLYFEKSNLNTMKKSMIFDFKEPIKITQHSAKLFGLADYSSALSLDEVDLRHMLNVETERKETDVDFRNTKHWKPSELNRESILLKDKYFKRSQSKWLAPELQEVLNPRSLATFESDVFAEGLVFGSLLLDGAHPFGSEDEEIIKNMINNKPVNVEKIESKRVRELILKMLTHKAEDRITSSDVVKKLESIQKEILEIPAMIDELGKNNVLIWYCRYCHQKDNFIESLKLIIEDGVNVNSVDQLGNNALHILCRNYKNENLIDIIRLLIEKGIDVNCKNRNGDNALHLLCENYQNANLIDIIRLLIEKGIDVNCKNRYEKNALHLLCENYQNANLIDIIRLLIEKGIDVNCKNRNGDNALHLLCENYQNANLIDIIRLFIENGIDVNCKNEGRWNILHFLCLHYKNENLIDIIRLLIENGIDVNCKNRYEDNALHLLCRHYKNENLIGIIRLLIENGMEIHGIIETKDKKVPNENALDKVLKMLMDKQLKSKMVRLLIRYGVQVHPESIEYFKSLDEIETGGKECLKFLAKHESRLGWHDGCQNCKEILSIEASDRRRLQHHQKFCNAYTGFHLILKDLKKWTKAKAKPGETELDLEKSTEWLLNIQEQCKDVAMKNCFKVMAEISEQIKNATDSSSFNCDKYEHYLRSMCRMADLIDSKEPKSQIEWYYLLPFDFPLLPDSIDPSESETVKISRANKREWDETLFDWAHKEMETHYGKFLKEDAQEGFFVPPKYNHQCHGQKQ